MKPKDYKEGDNLMKPVNTKGNYEFMGYQFDWD
jgi:hypothetical protein